MQHHNVLDKWLMHLSMSGTQAGQPLKPSEAREQPSPQRSVGSVMMDLTDGNTRETALFQGATTDFTLGGYTKAIEQGNHPAWGSQRTAQLEDVTAPHARPANNAVAAEVAADLSLGGYTHMLEHGSHAAWGTQRTAELQNTSGSQPASAEHGQTDELPTSASKHRLSRFGQSPAAANGSVSLSGQSPFAVKGRMGNTEQSPRPAKRRMSLVGQNLSALKRAQPEGQRSKWGFVPGEDDTLDLNMEKAGDGPAPTCELPHKMSIGLMMAHVGATDHVQTLSRT